jgi:DUF4097 and DUF4098 domain-containing protein YvlB
MDIERSFAPETIQQISVHLGLGDFKATGDAGSQIGLRAHVRSDDPADLEVTQTNGALHIRQRDIGLRRPQPVDVTLTIPKDLRITLTANLGKGDAGVQEVSGDLRLTTGKGDVAVKGGGGELRVQTGKGDIAASQRQGVLLANTGKGDVAVAGGAGPAHIQTAMGDVALTDWRAQDNGEEGCRIQLGAGDCRVRNVSGSRLVIQTGRGSCALSHVDVTNLRVETAKGDVQTVGNPGAGAWQITTAKGDIAVQLTAAVAARIDAATRRGTIYSDLAQVKVGRPGPVSMVGGGRSISVSGEEPRADIRLETVLGDIRVTAAIPERTAPPPAATRDAIPLPAPAVTPPAALAEPLRSPAEPQVAPPAYKTAMEVLESLARREITVDEAEALLRSLEGVQG